MIRNISFLVCGVMTALLVMAFPFSYTQSSAVSFFPAPIAHAQYDDSGYSDPGGYDNSGYSDPTYSDPSYDNSGYSDPTYSDPSTGGIDYGNCSGGCGSSYDYTYPSYSSPTYSTPTYYTPSYSTPTYQQPTQQSPQQQSCPSGYTLISGSCVPPTQSCPSGYTLENGSCVPPTQNCPAGDTLQNGSCVAPQTCPSGDTLQNGSCVPPTQNCPAGDTLQNGSCVPPVTNNNNNTNTNTNVINFPQVSYNYPSYPTPTPYYYNYPTCTLTIFPEVVQSYNQPITLSWNTQDVTEGSISYVGSVGPNGSVTVYPRQSTTYTGTFYGQNGQQVTCSATVSVNSYVPPIYNNPATPYVALSQVPYTGLDLGPVGTVLYWSFLILWCLLAAYLIVVKRIQNHIAAKLKTFLFGTPVSATTARIEKPTHTNVPTRTPVVRNFPEVDDFIVSQINRARA